MKNDSFSQSEGLHLSKYANNEVISSLFWSFMSYLTLLLLSVKYGNILNFILLTNFMKTMFLNFQSS